MVDAREHAVLALERLDAVLAARGVDLHALERALRAGGLSTAR